MKKLFYEDVYLNEWSADIIESIEKDGKFNVVLSETAFYPEGGGQPSDTGEIDGVRVIEVYEEDERIYHVLETKPVNIKVFCRLDLNRRFDLMQQHTGQHLFSAVFYNKYKGETSSFHLGDDYISVDISINDMDPGMARDVENTANDYIFKNIDVITHVTDINGLKNFPLRKLPPAGENSEIRIVEIDKIDFSPCCGTHVKRTGEIGLIKIIKTEKYKGSTRVYLKCGMRALYDYQNKTDLALNLGKYLSVPEGEILKRVENEGLEIKALQKQLIELKENLNEFEAVEFVKNNSSDKACIIFDDKNLGELQSFARYILSKKDYMLIFGSSSDKKVLLASSGNLNIDCGKLLKEHLSKFSGRGGGGPRQAQAAFENLNDMKAFVEFIKNI